MQRKSGTRIEKTQGPLHLISCLLGSTVPSITIVQKIRNTIIAPGRIDRIVNTSLKLFGQIAALGKFRNNLYGCRWHAQAQQKWTCDKNLGALAHLQIPRVSMHGPGAIHSNVVLAHENKRGLGKTRAQLSVLWHNLI